MPAGVALGRRSAALRGKGRSRFGWCGGRFPGTHQCGMISVVTQAVRRAAECAKGALDQRMPHPQELEDGLAGFFGPSVIVFCLSRQDPDKVFQRRSTIPEPTAVAPARYSSRTLASGSVAGPLARWAKRARVRMATALSENSESSVTGSSNVHSPLRLGAQEGLGQKQAGFEVAWLGANNRLE